MDLDGNNLMKADSEETVESGSTRSGMLEDYVSKQMVRATPEERDAVQVFSRRLVEDYGYPIGHLRTRPQYRIRSNPSGSGRKYPIDIALFSGSEHIEDNLFMIVECKRKTRKDGLKQLKIYLDMSQAEVGVWFNGNDHVYLQKVFAPNGKREFKELPNIPRYGQRIEDIGLYRREDLVKASNLKAVFRDLRNHLAGNAPGITRDEALAQEIINLLFCKIYDEVNAAPTDIVQFRAGHNEAPKAVKDRILELFENVKIEYPDVFDPTDAIKLNPASIAYVVGELQPYSLIEAERDAIGDAFEVFIGPALRGGEGQFFTPRNAVRTLVEMVDPKPGEMIIDPACGSGGFLTVALEHVWRSVEKEGKRKKWSAVTLDRRKRDIASRTFRGMDKDGFLAKCTKAYMAIIGDGRGGVFEVESSLLPPDEWPAQVREKIIMGSFDVVLTNPPFGKKIKVTGSRTLAQYDLGHKWSTNSATGTKEQTEEVLHEYPPQLLFLERCFQLLKPGGRLGIVLPESLLGSPSYSHIVEWMQRKARVLAVAAMPEPLFKTSGSSGTHTKVCLLVMQKLPAPGGLDTIFMADAKWCGHDSRGNQTVRKKSDGKEVLLDDLPAISERYEKYRSGHQTVSDHLGFAQPRQGIAGTILVPKYYDPELAKQLSNLQDTHTTPAIGDFVNSGTITITTGVEVGKMAYGTGPIPFIRTSDLSNWELKADPKQGVSEELYAQLKSQYPTKFDVQAGDIFVVKDGTYLVGTSAVVSSLDTKILYQSHLYKLRVNDPDVIDPWLLFAALNSPIAKRQMRAMRFTQDIIDTLGNRILEVRIPIPRDETTCKRIARQTEEAVQMRAELRERTRLLSIEIEGEAANEDLSSLEEAT